MKKDLNEIAKLEKAIKDKYGVDAINHPKRDWTEEKEKAYIEQMKEFYKKLERNAEQLEREERGGFFISKKSAKQDSSRACKTCGSYSLDSKDDVYFTKYDCCYGCYIMYIDGMGDLKRERESRWLSGWRPNNTRGFGK